MFEPRPRLPSSSNVPYADNSRNGDRLEKAGWIKREKSTSQLESSLIRAAAVPRMLARFSFLIPF
jgi:hypothetical protein